MKGPRFILRCRSVSDDAKWDDYLQVILNQVLTLFYSYRRLAYIPPVILFEYQTNTPHFNDRGRGPRC